mmetsp:Transcript_82991/g.130910  ORF Transcript_82991/g.130910 Transcript_82991/m.130910 type:complete len:131 (+) Transcript_82991:60-452(+)|eukprot:CAMPEP_0169246680 /NCGR_PEP_ID=MMETSP1016-20121227/34866_1 /TAXON_ID=342587 /ORGANISM="Karlodinium micrum, Strain CCMP2283" /LENGTH=130 /DNA_ID=CAMNT_0009327281 /DNA_START=56 /DNA_END=448 /DNA_ORIENTATION=+
MQVTRASILTLALLTSTPAIAAGKQESSLLAHLRESLDTQSQSSSWLSWRPWKTIEDQKPKPPETNQEATDERLVSFLSRDGEDASRAVATLRARMFADNDDYLGGFTDVKAPLASKAGVENSETEDAAM